tara:strand:+ start:239 stop:619 length:381 start_codon:yes stop_codon:yes gene_type:complete
MQKLKQKNGIQIDLISSQKMAELTTMEKIRMILDGVRNDKIVILETGLSPDEESKLIEITMSEIHPDGFTGIEIETHLQSTVGGSTFINKLMGRKLPSKLTVIGPANRIETLHKDDKLMTTFISPN